MNLVGNDVVDLGDPAIATSHLRERFVARVLTPSERDGFSGLPDPQVWLWSCFAAKEAAHKVLAKLDLRPTLQQLEVSRDLRSVRTVGFRLSARVRRGDGHVHAVVWLGTEEPRSFVGGLEEGQDPSLTVRASVRAALGGDPSIEILRAPLPGSWDGLGPPRLMRGGQALPFDVSLSHDGRFFAHALSGG